MPAQGRELGGLVAFRADPLGPDHGLEQGLGLLLAQDAEVEPPRAVHGDKAVKPVPAGDYDRTGRAAW